jgi:flagellar biosynthesis protein FliR
MKTETIETIAATLYVVLVAGLLVALPRIGLALFVTLMVGAGFMVAFLQSLCFHAAHVQRKGVNDWVIEATLGLMAILAFIYMGA